MLRLVFYCGAYELLSRLLDKKAFPRLEEILASHAWVHRAAFGTWSLLDIFRALVATGGRWLLVFGVGAIGGTCAAILLATREKVWRGFAADVDAWRSLPATILTNLVTAAVGVTLFSRTFPCLYVSFFVVLFQVGEHFAGHDRTRLRHLAALGADWRFLFRHCIPYETIGAFALALRQTASLSFLVLVSAEYILGSQGADGIGDYVYDRIQSDFNYYAVLPALVALGLFGFASNRVIAMAATAVENRVFPEKV